VVFRTLSALWRLLAYGCFVAIALAVEPLCDLAVWHVSFGPVDFVYPTISVEKLNGQNYHTCPTTLRAIRREFEFFDIVNGNPHPSDLNSLAFQLQIVTLILTSEKVQLSPSMPILALAVPGNLNPQ